MDDMCLYGNGKQMFPYTQITVLIVAYKNDVLWAEKPYNVNQQWSYFLQTQ